MPPPTLPSAFPTEEMFDELVDITVGNISEQITQQTFQVYRGVIRFYSGYFNAAFNGAFREAADKGTSLPSEDPLVFRLFVHWIHTRRLYNSTLEPSVLLNFMTIAKLWVFADAHHVPLLQNHAADIFAQKLHDSNNIVDDEAIRYIEENTMASAALQRLLHADLVGMAQTCPAYHVHELNETCCSGKDKYNPED